MAIHAPRSWAAVDGPKPARRPMAVVVLLPNSLRISYTRGFRSSMDAIGQALETYPGAVRVSVKPVAEVRP